MRILVIEKRRSAPPSPLALAEDAVGQAILERNTLALREHKASVSSLEAFFAASPQFEVTWTSEALSAAKPGFDLILTVGGDGTFLVAARHVGQTPMLGVNSAPATSVGAFCPALADTLPQWLEAISAKALSPVPRTRLEVLVGEHRVGPLALNDVLFAHQVPVGATRYALSVHGQTELHLSSGLWIATGSGSTAAIASAGGSKACPNSPLLQYRVRELARADALGLRLRHGFTDALTLTSRSEHNAFFFDGELSPYPLPYGQSAMVRPSAEPLLAYLPVFSDLTPC